MDGKKPYMVLIFIQLIYTGLYVICKAALDNGLSSYVFVFYRQAAASILFVPLAIIFERKSAPPLPFPVLLKAFMHATLGITLSLNMYNIGLIYTSATVGSATTCSIPVNTFFLALLLRMETMNLRSLPGGAKALGVALCLAGITTIAFYTGPHLNPLIHYHPFGHKTSSTSDGPAQQMQSWIKGTFIMITANAAWSSGIVLQGILLNDYPSKLLLTTLQCLLSTVQSFFVAMIFERDVSRWKIGLDTGLLAILYCGFVVSGVSYYLQTWCIEKKGPVFLAMSTPLALVFTIICSSFFLGELIHLGSVLGGVLMVGGLYSVLWGKGKEDVVRESINEDVKNSVEERGAASPFHPV
ncbi:WAT1-related protein At5g64700-like [Phoenix dactylifera]|uniref:WAT1-related protein n=1 Tax=Phoenix dactylifera TaxID=42345 RepID=A0A8B9AQX5_PHODC|nr:WAT1-related protein At5g64700-like [Phoenix dactylifera]